MNLQRTAFAFAALAASLNAQTDPAAETASEEVYELPELVVTGLLWESELQNTTASVSVIDSERFNASGSQHFEDIINTIPNVTWTGGTSRPRYIQIRGIGENSQFEGETPDSSVRFLVDDFDFTGLGSIGNLFDTQQVEVLRGPQAGAFGVNAAGGVIKMVTADPTDYWTGKVEGTVGEDSLYAGGVAVGGPLAGDELTFRFSAYQLTQDGFRDNKTLNKDDTNERDELTSQLKLRWKPSNDFQLDGSIFYADVDNGYDEFTLNNDPEETYSDEPGRDEQESVGTSLRATYGGWDAVELISISQFTTTDSLYSFDGDWGAGPGAPAPSTSTYTDFLELDRDRDVISQEFRLNSKDKTDALGIIDRWTIGVYAHALDEESYPVWDSGAIWDTDYEAESFALFGQATHEFSDTTRLTVQLRVEYYEVDVAAEGDFYGTLFDYSLDSDDTLWSGNITLEQDLSDTILGHITLNRGYKAGGASTPNFTAAEDITYDDETLWTAEAGIRARFFEEQVETAVTAFYIYREDPQFRDSQGAGSFFDYITVNGDSAEHFGLESEATWFVSKNWTLNASLGLLDAERDSYSARGVDVGSRELANAPTYTYSARADFSLENGFFANMEVAGSDNYYESNSHEEKRDSYAIFNGAIGFRYEGWKLTFWGRNLFDKEYEERVFYFNNTDFTDVRTRYESPAAPQQFGATLNYSW